MTDGDNGDTMPPESKRPIRYGLGYLGFLLIAVMLILLYTAGLI